MTALQILADQITGHFRIISMTLADFSDADMLVRPAPTANHALWQLGHLLTSDIHLGQLIGADLPKVASDLDQRFNKDTSKSDSASTFLPKDQLLAQIKEVRQALAQRVLKMTEADFASPAPENLRRVFPTVGNIVGLLGSHYPMHIGQMQVIRRKLGKPVMF